MCVRVCVRVCVCVSVHVCVSVSECTHARCQFLVLILLDLRAALGMAHQNFLLEAFSPFGFQGTEPM